MILGYFGDPHAVWIVRLFRSNYSDLTPNGGLGKGNPLISAKSRLVKYYNLARLLMFLMHLMALKVVRHVSVDSFENLWKPSPQSRHPKVNTALPVGPFST